MASIRLVAQDMIDVARDGIGWIALWKDGKGWMAADFWPDDMDATGTPTWSEFDRERLQRITELDPGAIVVNGYYHNLGDTTCMTRDTLANALRWQYDLKRYLIDDHLIDCMPCADC